MTTLIQRLPSHNDLTVNTRTHNIKALGRYRLHYIREIDGAQYFKALDERRVPSNLRTIVLTGEDVIQGVKLSDEGEMHYFASYTRGKNHFTKDEPSCLI